MPLERPPKTAEQLAREQRQAFEAQFAPAVREALRDLDWEPLDKEIEHPPIAYQVLEECPVDYIQNASLSTANDLGGVYKVRSSTRFSLDRAEERKGRGKPGSRTPAPDPEIHVRYTPQMLAFFLEEPNGEANLSISVAKELSTRTFRLADRKAFFRGESSPIFFSALHRSPLKKTSKNARTLDQNVLLDFFPELPTSTRVGAEASWDYNLVFDKKGGLKSRPQGQVRLEAWLRVREQRVAYLTVLWPQDEEVWIADPSLPIFSLRERRSATTYLQQKGDVEGHFLVSENGFVLLAHFEGVALETTESQVYRRDPLALAQRFRGRGGRAPRELATITDREEVFFSFTTKALQDCNGDFLRKVEPEPISTSGIEKLSGEFISLFTIGRKKEALARLSPEIRYAFTDEFISQMLSKHFEIGGMDSFGKPLIVESDVVSENVLHFEGLNRSLKTKTYSSFRGEIRDGVPVLTFIGTSSSPEKSQWDILELSKSNIFTQVKIGTNARRRARR